MPMWYRRKSRRGKQIRHSLRSRWQDDGRTFEGFQFGSGDVVFDDTLLLIEPEEAKSHERPIGPRRRFPIRERIRQTSLYLRFHQVRGCTQPRYGAVRKPISFYGSAEVPTMTAKMRLV